MKVRLILGILFIGFIAQSVLADGPTTAPSVSDRYGILGLLDNRSIYGQNWFPEPLQADEADVDNEVTATWFHSEKPGSQFNTVSLEVEKAFDLLTLEIAPGYESDRVDDDNQQGFTNIEFGARHPIFQYVSPHGFLDTIFVAGLEISPPTHTKISRDTELVPKLFNLTRLGEHLSIQTALGDSILVGPRDRGTSTLEYDVVLGYELTRRELPLPLVYQTIPIAEVDGEYTLNNDDSGKNELFATLGARFVLDSLDWLPAQPRLGFGYTFPINNAAREEFHWGIVTSLIFEY